MDELISLFMMTAVYVDYENHSRIEDIILTHPEDLNGGQHYYLEIGRGMIRYYLKHYDEALAHYVIATTKAYDTGDANFIADANRYMGIIYRKLNDLDQASYYIEKSVSALKDVDSKLLYATVYLTCGVILVDTGELEHGIRVYKKAYEYFNTVKDAKRHVNYVILLFNMFDVFDSLDKADMAHQYFDEIRLILNTGDFPVYNPMMLRAESRMLKRQGLYEQALSALEKFLKAEVQTPKYTAGYYKNEIKQVFDQIAVLKDKNRSLNSRLTLMYDSMDTSLDHMDYEFEKRLDQALDQEGIYPHFQLKWSVEQNKYIGAEALIRWQDKDKMIPPSDFIHEAEKSDLIIRLSELIIHKSLKFCKDVVTSGLNDFKVSVNISPYQLANQDLAKYIRNELLFFNLEGSHLKIEITERSFLEQNPKILEELYVLKEMGIKIALDDFGTGYSSLSCVTNFPIDVIKIDRSLINNIEDDMKSRKLLAGIIRMMKELDLEIVAEGVENEKQVAILKQFGCDVIQGYYYAKPDKHESVKNNLTSYKK